MLLESKLPKYLWTYAVMAPAYVRNRMYCPRIDDTPFHLVTGIKPSISKLHKFGSVCYANIYENKKLDARSNKGYFIGYDKYSAAYLIYFPETKKVMKNLTVKFTNEYDYSKADDSHVKSKNRNAYLLPNTPSDTFDTDFAKNENTFDNNFDNNSFENDFDIHDTHFNTTDEFATRNDESNVVIDQIDDIEPKNDSEEDT